MVLSVGKFYKFLLEHMKNLTLTIVLTFFSSATAYSDDFYQFDKMFPSVAQPWYFHSVGAATYDKESDSVIIMDKSSGIVTRLNPQGMVINRWGGIGEGSGKFNFEDPFRAMNEVFQATDSYHDSTYNNMDVDKNGNIYITDPHNNRVQKFSFSGKFLEEFTFEEDSISSVAVSQANTIAFLFSDRIDFYKNDQLIKTVAVERSYTDITFINEEEDYYLASRSHARKVSYENDSYSEWELPNRVIFPDSSEATGSGGIYSDNPDGVFVDAPVTNISVNSNGMLILALPVTGKLYIYQENGELFYEKEYFQSHEELVPDNSTAGSISDKRQVAAFFIDENRILTMDQLDGFINIIDSATGDTKTLGVSFSGDLAELGSIGTWSYDKNSNQYIMVSEYLVALLDTQFNIKHSRDFQINGQLTEVLDISFEAEDKIILALNVLQTSDKYILVLGSSDLSVKNLFSLDSAITFTSYEKISLSADNFNNIFIATTTGFSLENIKDKIYQFNTELGVFYTGEIPFLSTGYPPIYGYNDIAVISKGVLENEIYLKGVSDETVFSYIWDTDGVRENDFDFGDIKVESIFSNSDELVLIDKKFNMLKIKDNNLTSSISIGSSGVGYSNYSDIKSLKIEGDTLYISEQRNNRLQILKLRSIPNTSKAVILAGGDQSGNALWDEAQANANHAFWSLANQGYSKTNIHYLNHNTDLDLDGNGEPDDVDGIPSLANVRATLTEWAAQAVEGEPVEDVVLYMIGHGGNGTFELGNGEILIAAQLDAWLDELQAIMPGKVTVIYDGCQSGSFQPAVGNASSNRTVITSSQADQNAYFQDAISFSHLFWNQVFSGKTLSEAFQATRTSISLAFPNQSPLMDGDGDGVTNSDSDYAAVAQQAIGNGTVYSGSAPVIGNVNLTPVGAGESTSTITVSDITDDQGVQSAWGIVTPPYADLTQLGTPVQNLPRFDLFKKDDGSYTGSFDGFEQPGTYQIAIYAQDQEGNTSIPQIEPLNVINPLGRKALLVAGMDVLGQFSPALQKQTDHAYAALTGQGYLDSSNQSCTTGDSVCYLSANAVSTPGVDRATSKEGLEHAIEYWAADSTSDLVVYLVGDMVDDAIRLSDSESVLLSELRQWLDQVQASIDGTLTVIHEGTGSGATVAALGTVTDGSKRIVISSSALAQGSHLPAGGDASFSRYFWGKIAQGGDVEEAFAAGTASLAMLQTPQINANGNGLSNEKNDRYRARFHHLGLGILLAANEPEIGTIPLNTEITGSTRSQLWADQITSLSSLSKVWAVIEPPGFDPVTQQTGALIDVSLQNNGQGRWVANHSGFDKAGVYAVHYYAQDSNGRISPPRTAYLTQTQGPDAYEVDNNATTARYLSAITDYRQWHNFSDLSDTDYIAFDADPLRGAYTIKVDSTNSSADAAFRLYDADENPIALGVAGSPQEYTIDALPANGIERIFWTPSVAGRYLLKVTNASTTASALYSDGYTISIFPTDAPQDASISGTITNADGAPVIGATVYTDENQQAITNSTGGYALKASFGDRSITVTASGYTDATQQLNVAEGQIPTLDMTLSLPLREQNLKPQDINLTSSIPTVQGLKLATNQYPKNHSNPIVVQALQMNVPENGATLHHLTINSHGSSNEATDVSAVKLYHDTNQNQQVDSGDIPIGSTYTFTTDNGNIELTLPEPYTLSEGQQQILVAYEVQ